MAASTINPLAFLSNDADFQAWVTALHNAINGLGLVQTADTGQINPATVTRPGTSTFAGYEIWRFDDSLQSTKPVFLKLEYGIATVADRPALAITVGTGSNGSGTLTGQIGARRTLLPTASKTATTTLPTFVSGTSSRLTLAANQDAAANQFGMVIDVERTKDASGAETSHGIVFFTALTANFAVQVVPFSGSVAADPGISAGASFIDPRTQGLSTFGADVGICPLIVFAGQPLFALVHVYKAADLGANATVTSTVLGSSHTLMTLGAAHNPTLNGTCNFAIPYE